MIDAGLASPLCLKSDPLAAAGERQIAGSASDVLSNGRNARVPASETLCTPIVGGRR
jgi:hypothetical protein